MQDMLCLGNFFFWVSNYGICAKNCNSEMHKFWSVFPCKLVLVNFSGKVYANKKYLTNILICLRLYTFAVMSLQYYNEWKLCMCGWVVSVIIFYYNLNKIAIGKWVYLNNYPIWKSIGFEKALKLSLSLLCLNV